MVEYYFLNVKHIKDLMPFEVVNGKLCGIYVSLLWLVGVGFFFMGLHTTAEVLSNSCSVFIINMFNIFYEP